MIIHLRRKVFFIKTTKKREILSHERLFLLVKQFINLITNPRQIAIDNKKVEIVKTGLNVSNV